MLHRSIKYGYFHIAKYLIIEKGADINLANQEGLTPIKLTVLYQQVRIFGFLMLADAEYDQEDLDEIKEQISENKIHKQLIDKMQKGLDKKVFAQNSISFDSDTTNESLDTTTSSSDGLEVTSNNALVVYSPPVQFDQFDNSAIVERLNLDFSMQLMTNNFFPSEIQNTNLPYSDGSYINCHENIATFAFTARNLIIYLPQIKYVFEEILHVNASFLKIDKNVAVISHFVFVNIEYTIMGKDIDSISSFIYLSELGSSEQLQNKLQKYEDGAIKTPYDFVTKCGTYMLEMGFLNFAKNSYNKKFFLNYDLIYTMSASASTCLMSANKAQDESYLQKRFIASSADSMAFYFLAKSINYDYSSYYKTTATIMQMFNIIPNLVMIDQIVNQVVDIVTGLTNNQHHDEVL